MPDNNNGDVWGAFKRRLSNSFKPAEARADEDVKQTKEQVGNQLQSDMQETPEERKKRLMKGFEGR